MSLPTADVLQLLQLLFQLLIASLMGRQMLLVAVDIRTRYGLPEDPLFWHHAARKAVAPADGAQKQSKYQSCRAGPLPVHCQVAHHVPGTNLRINPSAPQFRLSWPRPAPKLSLLGCIHRVTVEAAPSIWQHRPPGREQLSHCTLRRLAAEKEAARAKRHIHTRECARSQVASTHTQTDRQTGGQTNREGERKR